MPWRIRFHPAVKKDLRHLSSEARYFIIQKVFPLLGENPYAGEPLHGPLKGLWKYITSEKRIAYLIYPKLKEVVIIEIGPRGGFYGRLRRRLGK